MSSLTLKRSQIADFKSFASVLAGDDIRLSISDGVIRLFAIHLASGEAFTLGFFSNEIVYVPAAMYEGLEFKYEAMSSVFLGFDKVERIDNNEDIKHLEAPFFFDELVIDFIYDCMLKNYRSKNRKANSDPYFSF